MYELKNRHSLLCLLLSARRAITLARANRTRQIGKRRIFDEKHTCDLPLAANDTDRATQSQLRNPVPKISSPQGLSTFSRVYGASATATTPSVSPA